MLINDNIKKIRINNGLSQEKFAEKIYFSSHTISNWERGVSTPNINAVDLISNKFNVPMNQIFSNTNPTDIKNKIFDVSISMLKKNIIPTIDNVSNCMIINDEMIYNIFHNNNQLIEFVLKQIDKEISPKLLKSFQFKDANCIISTFMNKCLYYIINNSELLAPLYQNDVSKEIIIQCLKDKYSYILKKIYNFQNKLQSDIIISSLINIIESSFTYNHNLSYTELKHLVYNTFSFIDYDYSLIEQSKET